MPPKQATSTTTQKAPVKKPVTSTTTTKTVASSSTAKAPIKKAAPTTKSTTQSSTSKAGSTKKPATTTAKKGEVKKEATKKQEEQKEQEEEEKQQLDKEEEVKKEENKVGKNMVKYSHYNKEFATLNGEMKWTDIDEEYAISFVFEGKFGKHLLKEGDENKKNYLNQRAFMTDKTDEKGELIEETMFMGLEDGVTYKLIVVEDEEAEAKREHVGYKAEKKETETKRQEGCSCLFGNPCLDKYVCQDWNNREAVAKKNGWKGFS